MLSQRTTPGIQYEVLTIVFKTTALLFHSIRIGGPAHGIVTKTVHKTLPRGGGGGRGLAVVGVGVGDLMTVRYQNDPLCMT